jgi:hypothetical protein
MAVESQGVILVKGRRHSPERAFGGSAPEFRADPGLRGGRGPDVRGGAAVGVVRAGRRGEAGRGRFRHS